MKSSLRIVLIIHLALHYVYAGTKNNTSTLIFTAALLNNSMHAKSKNKTIDNTKYLATDINYQRDKTNKKKHIHNKLITKNSHQNASFNQQKPVVKRGNKKSTQRHKRNLKASHHHDLHFLASGDPQFTNSYSQKSGRNKKGSIALNDIHRNLDDLQKGVIIAGDLTENSRLHDEFNMYQNAIRPYKRKVFDTVGNHDVIAPTWYQSLACHLGHSACVKPASIDKHILSRKRDTEICSHSSGGIYAWNWENVRFISLGEYSENPEAIEFLKNDLSTLKKSSPIVLISHKPIPENTLITNATKDFNLVLSINGHIHQDKSTCTFHKEAKHLQCTLASAIKGKYSNIIIMRNKILINGKEFRLKEPLINITEPLEYKTRKHCKTVRAPSDFPIAIPFLAVVVAAITGYTTNRILKIIHCSKPPVESIRRTADVQDPTEPLTLSTTAA